MKPAAALLAAALAVATPLAAASKTHARGISRCPPSCGPARLAAGSPRVVSTPEGPLDHGVQWVFARHDCSKRPITVRVWRKGYRHALRMTSTPDDCGWQFVLVDGLGGWEVRGSDQTRADLMQLEFAPTVRRPGVTQFRYVVSILGRLAARGAFNANVTHHAGRAGNRAWSLSIKLRRDYPPLRRA